MAAEEQTEMGDVHQGIQEKKACVVCGKPAYSKKAKFCLDCLAGCKPASVEYAVSRSIRLGELKPIDECICVDCGRPAQHYDHRDYNKPLEVDPVCRVCNAKRGHAIRFGRNAKGEWLNAAKKR